MKPVKAVNLLTILRFVLLCFFITTISLQLNAQCGSGLQSKSYSVVLTGTGNNVWGFSIPQFNPSIGTLVAVDIKSAVSVNYSFNLENNDDVAVAYTAVIERDDFIQSAALHTPVYKSVIQNFGPYTLAASDGIPGSGPDYISQGPIAFLNNYIINDSITDAVAGFFGLGSASFSYIPSTYVFANGGADYSLSGTAADTMKITLTYYYCTTNILSSDITSFSVTKEPGALAQLDWVTENEIAGRTYEIEESNDGKNFNDIASSTSVVNGNSSSNYRYDYALAPGTSGKLYFRLKEINADGYVKYSEIRNIEIDNNKEIYLYPNPADNFINIVFNEPATEGWQVDIFAADGRLVQRNQILKTGIARIDFLHRLAKGVYIMRANDTRTKKMYTQSFIVR
jgi:type IX secretion system substrate protein